MQFQIQVNTEFYVFLMINNTGASLQQDANSNLFMCNLGTSPHMPGFLPSLLPADSGFWMGPKVLNLLHYDKPSGY